MWANRIPPFVRNKARSQLFPIWPFSAWMIELERNSKDEDYNYHRTNPSLEGVCQYCPTPENCINCLGGILRGGDTTFFVRANSRKKAKNFQIPYELNPFIKSLSETNPDNLNYLRQIGDVLVLGRSLFNNEVLTRAKEDQGF